MHYIIGNAFEDNKKQVPLKMPKRGQVMGIIY